MVSKYKNLYNYYIELVHSEQTKAYKRQVLPMGSTCNYLIIKALYYGRVTTLPTLFTVTVALSSHSPLP